MPGRWAAINFCPKLRVRRLDTGGIRVQYNTLPGGNSAKVGPRVDRLRTLGVDCPCVLHPGRYRVRHPFASSNSISIQAQL
jgi:hypothetical protein